MSLYQVTASSLNFRQKPFVSSSNRIATLPQGHVVDVLNKEKQPWWYVSTNFRGESLTGYVHSNFLAEKSYFQRPVSFSSISAVHLTENRSSITRNRDGGRAYPLGESNRPIRDANDEANKVEQIGKIINWLQVENSERYIRHGSTTFCNIYAYDYCYLSRVYIPRVWWKHRALLDLNNGKSVDVLYGETVTELNANALHDWFEDFGEHFGWSAVSNINSAQAAANSGNIVIACAKRVTTNRPGHICAIAPEINQHKASRDRDGNVTKPLQSQAGSSNFRFKAANRWWTSSIFQSFGIWVHN